MSAITARSRLQLPIPIGMAELLLRALVGFGSMPVSDTVRLGEGVVIHHPQLVNLYGCAVDAGTRIGAFVEIQKNAAVGKQCKISSHSFVCEGVTQCVIRADAKR